MKQIFPILMVLSTIISCALQAPPQKNQLSYLPQQQGYCKNGYIERGIASWYGEEFNKKPTANGEIYDMYAMTAAHKTLPLGTWVTAIDLDTEKSVRVRINDRGPFIPNRIIDLSYAAAEALGILQKGTTRIEICCPFSKTMLLDELGYWVQIGAFTDKSYATKVVETLKKQYPKAQILSTESYFRVRIGPFRWSGEAYRLCDLLRNRGMSAFVIRDLTPISALTLQKEQSVVQGEQKSQVEF